MAKKGETIRVHLLAVRALDFRVDGTAADLLLEAAKQIKKGKIPTDPRVQFETFDPGGGGGPCAAWKKVDVFVSGDGLNPPAKPRP